MTSVELAQVRRLRDCFANLASMLAVTESVPAAAVRLRTHLVSALSEAELAIQATKTVLDDGTFREAARSRKGAR